jgi:hypothetical protein
LPNQFSERNWYWWIKRFDCQLQNHSYRTLP